MVSTTTTCFGPTCGPSSGCNLRPGEVISWCVGILMGHGVLIFVHSALRPQVHWMLNVDAGVSDHDSDIFLVVSNAGTWTGVVTGYWD